jgi:predicted NBD/HSP70 family sugar kinase
VPARELVGQRSETVRRANLSAIARELHIRGALSRSELVARTGLTRSAIRGLIGEFVAAGLVTEERSEPDGLPGRPSPLVRPLRDRAVVLALEIAVDSLAAALVGFDGQTIQSVRVDRPRDHSSVEEITRDLVELLRRLTLLPRLRPHLLGVGVAIVGVVRREDGLVVTAPNLGWQDVRLGTYLAEGIGLDLPVHVGNDADLGALVELRRGAARGADDLLFVSGEIGVGGGVVVAGQPLAGAAGYAGEIGHMPFNPQGRPCRCGSIGCWETEIGEEALLRLAGRDVDGGRAAVDEVIEAARRGDAEATSAVHEVGRRLGVGIAGLVNILNPRVVVVGGLFSRLYPMIAASVAQELDRRAMAAPRSSVRVAPAALGVDAPLLGAAELAFEAFLVDPAAWLGVRDEVAAATA